VCSSSTRESDKGANLGEILEEAISKKKEE
jgi:hypothetical protein